MIKIGSIVSLSYVGKLENGEVFDNSEDNGGLLRFEVGSGQLIPGFENGVLGRDENDEFTIQIPSNEAYGDYKEELVMAIPKDRMPEGVQVGTMLNAESGDEQNPRAIPVVVKEITDNDVIIDANHPLAGQNLTFEIKVVSVEQPETETAND